MDELKEGNYLTPINYETLTPVEKAYLPDALKFGVKYEILSVLYFDDLSVLVRLNTEYGSYGIHFYINRLLDYFKVTGIKEERLEKLQELMG